MRISGFFAVLTAFAIAALFVYSEAYAVTRTITFPVSGTYSYRNDFAEPRDGGSREHLGIDIIASKMTPLVSAVDGIVTFIAIPQASWGYAITIRDSEGYQYRYLHINNDSPGTDDGLGGVEHAYAPELKRGSAVTKGQLIGWVGDSGNAEGTVSHLHFEIRSPDRTPINPYDSLLAASGGQTGIATTLTNGGAEPSLEDEELFIERRQLQEGMADRDIATLHEQLKTLGYYTGAISETYSSVTREAVRKFQNDNSITPTGIADALTRRTLEQRVKAHSVSTSLMSQSSSLAEGSEGETVRVLQMRLAELGYFNNTVTGYFGPITKAAVIAFQSANGIDPIGIVGPLTRSALNTAVVSESATTESSYEFTLYLTRGSRGEDVRQLQIVLARLGHFATDATGYYGVVTEEAVISFQRSREIEPAGVVGPLTRQALNAL